MISESSNNPVLIRQAAREDAVAITRIFLESAQHHASLDGELYLVPAAETIASRYREGRQHPEDGHKITLVAELTGEIVGFIDVRLYQPLDAMHRETNFCLVSEIAVRREYQSQGIGRQLLRAAEDWGRELGAEFALVEYHAANKRAGSFYQQLMGYRVTSITTIKRLERQKPKPE